MTEKAGDAMSQTDVKESTFSEGDDESFVEYKSISRLAVASLGFGILSFLAMFHALLWFVPAVAIAFGVAAVRGIAARNREFAGNGFAIAGMSFAALFWTWGAARMISHDYALTAQAREHCDEWLDMVTSRRLYEAFELHLKQNERQPAKVNLASMYGTVEDALLITETYISHPEDLQIGKRQKFYNFWTQGPKFQLAKFGKDGEIEFDRREQVTTHTTLGNAKVDRVPLRYYLTYMDDKGEQQTIHLVVRMDRIHFYETKEWFVYDVEFVKGK